MKTPRTISTPKTPKTKKTQRTLPTKGSERVKTVDEKQNRAKSYTRKPRKKTYKA